MEVSHERRRAARTAVLAVAGSLFGVLVVWAALVGPQQVFEGPGPTPSTVTTSTTSEPPLDDQYREDAEEIVRSTDPPAWLRLVVWAFELLLLAGLVALLLLAAKVLRDRWNGRRRRADEARLEVELDPLAPDLAREALARGSRAQDDALETGSPRNGIVAVWHTLETQAAESGLERRASQTPAEFVLRLLDLADAEPRAVTVLADLYREARFSDHPMAESDRQRARELLAAIRTRPRAGNEAGR